MASARNHSTSGRSTDSQPTGAGPVTPDNTSSGASVTSGSTTSGPDRQEASAMLSLVMGRFVDNDIDAPFVPAAYLDHTNDPLAATHTRYAQRNMADRLEAILQPLVPTHGVDDNDASSGASDTDDEAWPPIMTPTTEASDSESLLSLSDDEEHQAESTV